MTTYKITEVTDYKNDLVFKVYRKRIRKPWWFGKEEIVWDCMQRTIYASGSWDVDSVFKTRVEAQAAIDRLEAQEARPEGTVVSESVVEK